MKPLRDLSQPDSLPLGWASATLGRLSLLNPRGFDTQPEDDDLLSFVPMAAVEAGTGRLDSGRTRPWKEIKKGYTPFQNGDVLFAKITPCMENGKAAVAAALAGGRGAGSTEFHVLRPVSAVPSKFLLLFLSQESFRRAARASMKGTAGQLRVPESFVESATIPVPPLSEQERIVEEVEKQFTRLEAAVDALKRVRVTLKRYRASVLKAACDGLLVPTEAELATAEGRDYEPAHVLLQRILKERRAKWEAEEVSKVRAQGRTDANDQRKSRYRQPNAPDVRLLPQLAEGWVWATVESISTKVVDGVHKKPNYVSNGIPFVTVRNLTAGPGISFERLNHITPDDHRAFFRRANPEKGDLLVSKDGTLGVIRVIEIDLEFSIFVSVALIKPVLRRMSGYLGVALSSPQVQIQMVPKGSGLQHIHLEDLRADCIPLPPLAEQQRIVADVERRLSVIEGLEALVAANLRRAERLRQSILKRAFEGKLVPQDPNDEPASVLLERIRAERKATSERGASRERGNRTKTKKP